MDKPQTLEPPDCHFFSAAVGWLELGNPREAELELDRIGDAHRDDEPVLTLRWFILERQAAWEKAREAAERMRQVHPHNPSGSIHLAYAIRRCPAGGLRAAWEALEPATTLFPKEPIIPYNLACYAAQLNRIDEAWTWLQKAFALGNRSELRRMALADPDLQPLWPRLSAGDDRPTQA